MIRIFPPQRILCPALLPFLALALFLGFSACQPASREKTPATPKTEATPRTEATPKTEGSSGMSSRSFGETDAPQTPGQKGSFGGVFDKTYIDTHNGYSEAVVITSGDLKTIHISGQIGEGETLDAQMRSALGKLMALLEGQGASMKDVVKINTYIVDYGPESLEVFRGVRKEMMGDADMPASTLVGVEALALPEWLIEIEAVAVVPVR